MVPFPPQGGSSPHHHLQRQGLRTVGVHRASVPCSVTGCHLCCYLLPSLTHSTPQQCPAQGPPQAALAVVPSVPAGCVVSVASTVHGGMLAPLSISASVALTCSISSSKHWAVGDCVGPPPRRLGSPQPPSPVRSGATPPPCVEKSWQRCWALYRSCRKSSRAERKSTHSRSSSCRSRGLAGACRSPASSTRRSPVG